MGSFFEADLPVLRAQGTSLAGESETVMATRSALVDGLDASAGSLGGGRGATALNGLADTFSLRLGELAEAIRSAGENTAGNAQRYQDDDEAVRELYERTM